MNIEKLMKQKADIEAAIKTAERVQKLKPKFEKIFIETLENNSDILLCNPSAFKKSLDDFLAKFAGDLEHRQQ